MPAASRFLDTLTERHQRTAANSVEHLIVPVETRQPMEFVDVTDILAAVVEEVGLKEGVLTIHTRHTTTGIMINEHEPLLLRDLAAMFERFAPTGAAYHHDNFAIRTVNLVPGERRNGHAHCRAALLRSSESVPVMNGSLGLGRWQRIFFVDFDGPQSRELWLTLAGQMSVDRS